MADVDCAADDPALLAPNSVGLRAARLKKSMTTQRIDGGLPLSAGCFVTCNVRGLLRSFGQVTSSLIGVVRYKFAAKLLWQGSTENGGISTSSKELEF
jgi:hypothetical protein